jgi:hypothetical protein
MLNKLFRRKKAPIDPKQDAEKERQKRLAEDARRRSEADSARYHNSAGL